MQRVSALLPLWEKAKPAADADNNNTAAAKTKRASTSSTASAGTTSGRKVFSWASARAAPKNLTVNPTATATTTTTVVVAGSREDVYLPSTLDRECEKAARILKSFCTDGFLDEEMQTPTSPRSRTSITSLATSHHRKMSEDVPLSPTTSLTPKKRKIPPSIVQDAVGLAIFSCVRSGLWMSGSGGSGILIARKADGTWSPPSGIILHTATVAFVVGVDAYDCVLVINSVAALELFTHPRLTLGADVPLTVGPLMTLGGQDPGGRWNTELNNTVLTYVKARGRHSPAQLYGSLVTERSNENERFYSDDNSRGGLQRVDILDILAGNIRKSIPEILPLYEAIKAAEGRIDYDVATMERLSQQPAPGDADLADTPGILSPTSPKSAFFGVPDASDPDPFGIIALEMAGLEIREAGTKHRPTSTQFDYVNPSPSSPLFGAGINRQSADVTPDSANRASYISTRTQATSMTDACTQTDVAESPDTSLSPSHSDDGKDQVAAVAAVGGGAAVAGVAAVATAVTVAAEPEASAPAPTEAEAETPESTPTTADATTSTTDHVAPIVAPKEIVPAAPETSLPLDSRDPEKDHAETSIPVDTSSQGTMTDIGVPAEPIETAETVVASESGESGVSGTKFLVVDRPVSTGAVSTDTVIADVHSVQLAQSEQPEQPEPSAQSVQSATSEDTAVATSEDTAVATSSAEEDERNEDADDEDDQNDLDDETDDLDDDGFVTGEDELDDSDEEVPVVFEVATTTAQPIRAVPVTQMIQAKGALVTIPKRIPPPLPMRSPARRSRASKSEFGDVPSMVSSPLRNSFQSSQTEPASMPARDFDTVEKPAITVTSVDSPPTVLTPVMEPIVATAAATQQKDLEPVKHDEANIMSFNENARPVSPVSSVNYESAADTAPAIMYFNPKKAVDEIPDNTADEILEDQQTPRPDAVFHDRNSKVFNGIPAVPAVHVQADEVLTTPAEQQQQQQQQHTNVVNNITVV